MPKSEAELRLPFAAEIQLLRIVQEALANARKHARANRVKAQLTLTSGALRLVVEDDGQGFDPTRLAHGGWPRFGLQTMRERAEAIGGTFTVESQIGAGARVIVTIPQEQPEETFNATDALSASR